MRRLPALALKIPPPVLAAVLGGAMWKIGALTAPPPAAPGVGLAAGFIAVIGAGFGLAGLIALRRAGTTINPLAPQRTSALAVSGVYRISRNPMYLSLLLVLIAWALALSAAWTIIGPIAFFFYVGRFQIAPEEQAMLKIFGTDYSAYQARVRRWL